VSGPWRTSVRTTGRHGLENRKESFADIRRNIEDRILRDALAHVPKISSNYPRTPVAIATINAVLDWPESRDEVYQIIDEFIRRATAVDGVTGEEGLANYSAFGLQSTAMFLALWDRAIPGFLEEMLRRHPLVPNTGLGVETGLSASHYALLSNCPTASADVYCPNPDCGCYDVYLRFLRCPPTPDGGLLVTDWFQATLALEDRLESIECANATRGEARAIFRAWRKTTAVCLDDLVWRYWKVEDIAERAPCGRGKKFKKCCRRE
jgi:hypothetical protein